MILRLINFLYKSYLLDKQRIRIEGQKKNLAFVFDSLVEGKSEKEILKKVKNELPKEVRSIIKFVNKYNKKKIKIKKKKGLKISVVIPHFNQEKYLDKALESLVKQSKKTDEVIVVDDLSPNFGEVKKICKKYEKKLSLRLFQVKEKLYTGKTRQLGAEKAKGDIIIMHDADDVSHRDRIKVTKKFFEKYPNAVHFDVGYVNFVKDGFCDYVKDFDFENLDKYIIKTKEINGAMKAKFCDQKFSSPNKLGIILGGYGAKGKFGFLPQSGHLAYRKEVSEIVRWTSPNNFVFTKYEDYEYNFLLLLVFQKSYQIDYPLVYYRNFTSTNVVV